MGKHKEKTPNEIEVSSIWIVSVYTSIIAFTLFTIETAQDHRIALFESGSDAPQRKTKLVIRKAWDDPVMASLQNINLLAQGFSGWGFDDALNLSFNFRLARSEFWVDLMVMSEPQDPSLQNLQNAILDVCKLMVTYWQYRWFKRPLSLICHDLYGEQ